MWNFVAFLLFILLTSWTATVQAFEYTVDEPSLLHPSALQSHSLTQIFAKKGFRSLSDASLVSAGLPFDKVFVSGNWEKVLLLKAGLRVPSRMDGQLIEEKSLGLSVIHFQFEGTPYLLLSLHNTREELQGIVKPWLKSRVPVAWSLFFPPAQAKVCLNEDVWRSGIQDTAAHIEKNEMFQTIGKCALDALQGAGGAAADTLAFFKKLVSNPTRLWSEMKESFVQLKEFAQNIQSELQQTFASITSLSSELKLQMACNFAGSIMVGAVQSALGGAALGRVLPSLLLKLKGSTALIQKMGALESRGVLLPHKSAMMQEVMSCAY